MKRRLVKCLAVMALFNPLWSFAQGADAFPSKSIRIVVPFAAGGVTDALVRLLQDPIGKSLGQTVIVENKPGAAGMIGARAVADAPADGHTLLMVNTGVLAITPFVQADSAFHPKNSVTAVASLASAPSVLLVNPSVPANTVQEFIDYARSNPGLIEYAVLGKGAYGDLSTINFARQADIQMVSVSYQGNAQTSLALLSGEVKAQLTILSGAMNEYIKTGRVKALGVATREPSPLVPGVSTIAEALPGFEAVVLTGVVAPADTPLDVVLKLSKAFTEALEQPDIKEKLMSMGMDSAPLGPAAYALRIDEEIAQFAPAIKALSAL